MALNRASGDTEWTRRVSALVLALGRAGLFTVEDKQITTYDTGNGEPRWHRDTDGRATFAEVGETLLVSTTNREGRVQAYNAGNGEPLWDAAVPDGPIRAIGRLDTDTALVRTRERIVAIDVGDKGAQRWSIEPLGDTQVVSDGSTRLIGTVSDASTTTGTSSPSTRRTSTRRTSTASTSTAPTSASGNTRFVVIDGASGAKVTGIDTETRVQDMALADGVVYTYERGDKGLAAYDLHSGERLWRQDSSSGSTTSSISLLAVDGGLLTITGNNIKMLRA